VVEAAAGAGGLSGGAPVIMSEGRSYPVKTIYLGAPRKYEADRGLGFAVWGTGVWGKGFGDLGGREP
jgi:hypothetical protein